MNKIILCGGHGSRFKIQGIEVPKPLFEVMNYPLFWWSAISAIKCFGNEDIFFAVLRDHIKNNKIDVEIKKYFPHAKIIIIDKVTSGAADTALYCIEHINNLNPVLFIDCDIYFDIDHSKDITRNNNNKIHTLFSFKSNNPNYSYALIKNNFVINTAEKKLISNDAIAGIYFFINKNDFLFFYNKACDKNNKEFYLSYLFNAILKTNNLITNTPLSNHLSLGTPEEINKIPKLELNRLLTSVNG